MEVVVDTFMLDAYQASMMHQVHHEFIQGHAYNLRQLQEHALAMYVRCSCPALSCQAARNAAEVDITDSPRWSKAGYALSYLVSGNRPSDSEKHGAQVAELTK